MFVDTKTLRFWEANFTKGDIAEIAFKSEISHKKIKEAIDTGNTQEYIYNEINNYFKNKSKCQR